MQDSQQGMNVRPKWAVNYGMRLNCNVGQKSGVPARG